MKGKCILWILLGLLSRTLVAQELLTPAFHSESIIPTKSNDTVVVRLPFFDDFSNYIGLPNPALWLTHDAYVNSDYDSYPPTVGMVTLDAVDVQGDLHAGASTGLFSADTLASQPIRLDSLFSPYRKALSLSDSIMLSFYYLPGGGSGNLWERIGDCPNTNDSLFLEFYMPDSNRWVTVWSIGGISVDTLLAHTGFRWQYVCVPVINRAYLSSRFQFRFRNYCSLDANPKPGISGNCDQWHIDYVYLGTGRNRSNRYSRDVAFVGKAPTLLKRYYAMPARQFNATEMATAIPITISNLYSQTLATNYQYSVYRTQTGSLVHRYEGGYENAPVYWPNSGYQTAPAHASPSVAFTYPVEGESDSFQVVHVVTEGATGDSHRGNDTIRFDQIFSDYYAYDDGQAENGYGLTSTSSKVYLAYRFTLNQYDTLTSVKLYFNRTRSGENEMIPFYLCVWSDDNGLPGTLLYKDGESRTPQFEGLNKYVRYRLNHPVQVSGTIYVGIEQATNDYLNLGFDRGNDVSDQIFYRTASSWQPSILSGALMMRPCFGSASFVDIAQVKLPQVAVYPNPASRQISVYTNDLEPSQTQILLYNMKGQKMLETSYDESLDVSSLPRGVYMLILLDAQSGQRATTQLILQ